MKQTPYALPCPCATTAQKMTSKEAFNNNILKFLIAMALK